MKSLIQALLSLKLSEIEHGFQCSTQEDALLFALFSCHDLKDLLRVPENRVTEVTGVMSRWESFCPGLRRPLPHHRSWLLYGKLYSLKHPSKTSKLTVIRDNTICRSPTPKQKMQRNKKEKIGIKNSINHTKLASYILIRVCQT